MIRISFFICFNFFFFTVYAQTPVNEKVLYEHYSQLIHFFPDLHSGGQYFPSYRGVEGHPFYISKNLDRNPLIIGEVAFEEVPLQYDIVDDVIVSVTPAKGQKSILNHEKIDGFGLEGHTFIRIKEELPYFFHKNGFYRVVVAGEIDLFCKHRKLPAKNSGSMETGRKYEDRDWYLIRLEKDYHLVKRKKEAFELLGLKKKEVKPLLKKDRLRFKRDKEAYLRVLITKANDGL
jgi:hypothetical protein